MASISRSFSSRSTQKKFTTVEQLKFEVHPSGRTFDLADGANEPRRHGQTGDWKILYRALSLRRVQRVHRYLQFAHAVAFYAHFRLGHAPSPLFVGRQI